MAQKFGISTLSILETLDFNENHMMISNCRTYTISCIGLKLTLSENENQLKSHDHYRRGNLMRRGFKKRTNLTHCCGTCSETVTISSLVLSENVIDH